MSADDMDYITGIADFFMYRKEPPKWMNTEERARWRIGWKYASIQLIDRKK